jgi:hypothetical protein
MSDLAATLSSVTIYREGALCTRILTLSPGAGPRLRLIGLPLSLEPGSLRARVTRGADGLRVLDVRPQFDVELADELQVPVEQRALEAAQDELARLTARHARVEAEIVELQGLQPRFLEPRRGAAPRQAPVDAMLALGRFSGLGLAARLEERRALTRQLEDAQRELTLRQRRLREAGSARRTERARLSRVAVVTLSGPVEDSGELSLEYLVPGARWAPSYALRLEPGLGGGTLQLRAAVAQSTGEDWTGVRLALSTGSLSRRAELPELRALKIGRTQPPPPRSGWREPPPGLEALFEAYDAARQAPPPVPRSAPAPAEAPPPGRAAPSPKRPAPGAARLESSSKGGAPTMSMPAPAAPMSLREGGAPAAKKAMLSDADSDGGVDASLEALEAAPFADGDDLGFADPLEHVTARAAGLGQEQLDYGRLVMGDAADSQRGRLQPGSPWDFAFVAGVSVHVEVVVAAVTRAISQAAAVRQLPLPASCREVEAIDHFDYRYDCAAPVDVASTGAWTTVPVMTCDVGLTPGYVTVPAVDPKVYRTLQVANRSRHALPPGPVDVTQGDAFLLSTTLPAIPPTATSSQRLGLGVEEAIKVARKTTFKETTGGFLGGSTVLPHELEIEINNRLASPAPVEVRERVPWPAPDEKDLKVEEAEVSPQWELVETPLDGVVVKGARRWQVTVPAGGSIKLTAQFVIRMPGDRMIVGGNRRA